MNENITPLPWFAYFGRLVYGSTEEGEPCVAVTKHDPKAFYALSLNADECAANTAYIVEACNAYPALTARVKELEEALGDCVGMLRGFTSSEHDEEGAVTQQIKDADAALNKEPTT